MKRAILMVVKVPDTFTDDSMALLEDSIRGLVNLTMDSVTVDQIEGQREGISVLGGRLSSVPNVVLTCYINEVGGEE